MRLYLLDVLVLVFLKRLYLLDEQLRRFPFGFGSMQLRVIVLSSEAWEAELT